jgi:hypothetical protein
VFKFGQSIFVSYCEHHDAVLSAPTDAMMISRDNGKSWKKKIRNQDFYMTSMFEKDGILYGIVYFTYPDSDTRERMVYWTSADNGETWEKHEGTVFAPDAKRFTTIGKLWASMLFHRGMQVMPDGSVQGLMYGKFEGDAKYRSVWVKSTDNCATWQIVSTVASGAPEAFPESEGYCEPTYTVAKDGSLLCVMRISSYKPMYQCRSTDNGLTWTAPTPLPGLPLNSTYSVCPHLLLLKSGVLALSYGRPGDKLAFASDGCGYKWDCVTDSYTNETTGYSGMVETDENRILLISDQGRTGAKQMAIWARYIDVNFKAK